MPSRRVPRRSARCVHVASAKGRLGAARGGTGLHCFSRRGNLLSALFIRVSSFSLHHHRYATSITIGHGTASPLLCNRLVFIVRRGARYFSPALVECLDFSTTLESTLRATPYRLPPSPPLLLLSATLQASTISFPLTYTAHPRQYISRKNQTSTTNKQRTA